MWRSRSAPSPRSCRARTATTSSSSRISTHRGGSGDDTVTLPGDFEDFTIDPIDGGFRFTPTDGGAPIELASVEEIRLDDVTLALDTSPETRTLYLVYQSFLDRAADPFGLAFWRGVIEAGTSLDDVVDFFPVSDEFDLLFGIDIDNAAFVDVLYDNAFDRDPDGPGGAFWTARLDDGTVDRGGLGLLFAISEEMQTTFQNDIDDGLLVSV